MSLTAPSACLAAGAHPLAPAASAPGTGRGVGAAHRERRLPAAWLRAAPEALASDGHVAAVVGLEAGVFVSSSAGDDEKGTGTKPRRATGPSTPAARASPRRTRSRTARRCSERSTARTAGPTTRPAGRSSRRARARSPCGPAGPRRTPRRTTSRSRGKRDGAGRIVDRGARGGGVGKLRTMRRHGWRRRRWRSGRRVPHARPGRHARKRRHGRVRGADHLATRRHGHHAVRGRQLHRRPRGQRLARAGRGGLTGRAIVRAVVGVHERRARRRQGLGPRPRGLPGAVDRLPVALDRNSLRPGRDEAPRAPLRSPRPRLRVLP